MSDYCVVVTDGGYSRFFTLEQVDFPELESGPRLIDRGELFNPDHRTLDRDLYSSKMGRDRAPQGGPAHSLDDHRSKHDDELERRFGRMVLENALRIAKTNRSKFVVLSAPARMLGFLRQDLNIFNKHGIVVKKLGKDMTKLTSRQIHDHLAKKQILPERKSPGNY